MIANKALFTTSRAASGSLGNAAVDLPSQAVLKLSRIRPRQVATPSNPIRRRRTRSHGHLLWILALACPHFLFAQGPESLPQAAVAVPSVRYMTSVEASNRVVEVSNLISSQLQMEAAESVTNPIRSVRTPDFIKLTPYEASKAVDSITRQNREIVTDLVNQIRHGNLTPEGKTYAIYLLGEMHPMDAAAITVLVENIDFQPPRVDNEWGLGRWGIHPAQEALVKTGSHFAYVLVERLSVETNELRRLLICRSLFQALDEQSARSRVRQRLLRETEEVMRVNLEAATKELEKSESDLILAIEALRGRK